MQPANSARDGHRILIVDDAPEVRESLRWLLEDEPGLTVIGDVATGDEAIQMTVSLKPDLVLLDIELPDMDGFDVTRQIKALLNPPRIVILSMHNDVLYRKRGMDAGCDAFIGKEMGWSGLLPVLQRVLEGH
ncbi:MAG: response regulator transcription factor [Chloroflexi bacterium]|nr:response regulator transcription factor [Chloroflexota bacterium]